MSASAIQLHADPDGSDQSVARMNAKAEGKPFGSWHAIDLAETIASIQAGEITGPVPALMSRTDGVLLLYPGEVHSLAGEPETGKGWIVLATCAAAITAGQAVLYLDFEDAPASIIGRLLSLGADPQAILERFSYVQPVDPFAFRDFQALIRHRPYALAIVDGLSEAYSLLGLDPYSNPDAARFLTAVPRPIAALGAAVLEVDHVTKSKDSRGRWAIGAQHKLAGIAAAYSAEAIERPSRTTDGLIKLKVEKDRHGHVRGHAIDDVIALVRVHPENDGARVTVTLDPADTAASTDHWRPTELMERVSRYVEDNPGAGKRDIRDGVIGNNTWVEKALAFLVTDGHVDMRPDGVARRHYSLTPYRQCAHVPETCPDVPQHTPATNVPMCPAPTRGTAQGTPDKHTASTPNVPTDPDAEHDRLAAKYPELTQ